MINPFTVAVVYAVVGSAVALGVLRLFGSKSGVLTIVGPCAAAAVASMVPVIGGPLSLLVMIAGLYWQSDAELMAIAVAVGVARLAMVPALMALR